MEDLIELFKKYYEKRMEVASEMVSNGKSWSEALSEIDKRLAIEILPKKVSDMDKKIAGGF